MGTQQLDVISVLTHDHREVEELFGRLEAAPHDDGQARRSLVDQVITELVRHSVAEEMYLYPATRKYVPGGDEIADREIGDHAEVEKIMKQLEKAEATTEQFSTLLTRLISEVRAHVEDEESTLFPQLARHASAEELVELGKRVQAAKEKAPTRPHPAAPDRPPLNKLLGPGAGMVDRVRDYISGRGR